MYPAETVQLPPMLPGDRDDTPRFSWYLHWKLPEPRLRFLQEADEWTNIRPEQGPIASYPAPSPPPGRNPRGIQDSQRAGRG
jgi:hypothetical protein